MNLLKKVVSAVTAITMTFSVSTVTLTGTDILSIPAVMAAESEASYALSISKEYYDMDSLLTLADYQEYDEEKHKNLTDFTGIYKADASSKKITADSMDNKVAEVKLSIDSNIGIYSAQFYLSYDPKLAFAGCVYSKDGTLSPMKDVNNGHINVSAKYDKVIITYDAGKSFTTTGEFVTLLFVLPDDCAAGQKYEIGFNEKTANQITAWNPPASTTFAGESGFIEVISNQEPTADPTAAPTATVEPTAKPTLDPTAKPTADPTAAPTATVEPTAKPTVDPTVNPTAEPTALPSLTPTEVPSGTPSDSLIDIVLNTEKDKLGAEVIDNKNMITLENSASIKLEVPEKMAYMGTDKVEYKVKLSDFDAKTEYFDYAGFGLELPEGFTVDAESIKSSVKGNLEYISPDSLDAVFIGSKTNYNANGGYVMFRGIDTRDLARDAELFTLVLNVPASADKYAYDVNIAAVYGRLTSANPEGEQGKITPRVSFIDNGAGDKIYTLVPSKLLMGIKGDVNLDHKVDQIDATLMLKEALSLSVSGKSILKDSINTSEAGDSASALSYFLGDVDGSGDETFSQIDATFLLRAVLAADIAGSPTVTEKIWSDIIE